MRIPFPPPNSLDPLQHLLFFVILNEIRWNLKVGFVCISPIIGENEQFLNFFIVDFFFWDVPRPIFERAICFVCLFCLISDSFFFFEFLIYSSCWPFATWWEFCLLCGLFVSVWVCHFLKVFFFPLFLKIWFMSSTCDFPPSSIL